MARENWNDIIGYVSVLKTRGSACHTNKNVFASKISQVLKSSRDRCDRVSHSLMLCFHLSANSYCANNTSSLSSKKRFSEINTFYFSHTCISIKFEMKACLSQLLQHAEYTKIVPFPSSCRSSSKETNSPLVKNYSFKDRHNSDNSMLSGYPRCKLYEYI